MEDIETVKENEEGEEDVSQNENTINNDNNSQDNSDQLDDEPIQQEPDKDNTVLDSDNKTEESKLSNCQNNKEDNLNGKKKVREGKPFTKVVIRRLPPSMTKDVFLDQVSPLPSYDYLYFVSAPTSSTPGGFARAYINFINQNDLFDFTRTFDNYVFIDNRGHEYPAIVEFAPYQRVPKSKVGKKKDMLVGTIESDPVYIAFKEQLEAEALENSKTTNKQHYFETEISENEEIITTPLLEYLKQKRAEKDRIREEKREDRKRKEIERKTLKNKLKEKPIISIQGSGSAQVVTSSVTPSNQEDVEIKVLQPPKEKKDANKEKDVKRERTKHKDKEERFIKSDNRTREFKNKGGKSYREERLKQAEKREERKKKENNELSKDKEEQSVLSPTDRIAVDEEDKFWNDKKKWKHTGSGDVKAPRTFVAKRRDDKKKDNYDRKRNNKPFSRTRKGSGESIDDNKKSESSETQEKEDKIKDKSSNSKKDSSFDKKYKDETSKKNKDESLINKKLNEDIYKQKEESVSKRESDLSATSTNNQTHKCECHSVKDSKVSSEKTDRLQKESSVDSEEGSKTKDPRVERRIRNKDRPSIEIYRPGMGKFSRQRLEKEKTVGSTDESPSHSPSPQPSNSANNQV